MSVESAKAFIEKMKTDEGFARKVKECTNTESRMAFAKESGFNFTVEEIKLEGELSDDDLDAVAGGGCTKNG